MASAGRLAQQRVTWGAGLRESRRGRCPSANRSQQYLACFASRCWRLVSDHRQSGDLDPDSRRSSCAASSTRSAAPRVSPASPRARHQPELATERPNNGAITNPVLCRYSAVATSTGPPQETNPAPPPPPSPIGVRAGRQVSAVRASGPQCRGHPTAKAGLEHRSIRPIRQDQPFWYERPARPAGIRPPVRNTSACPAPSRPLSPARAYAVVRRTRRRGGAGRDGRAQRRALHVPAPVQRAGRGRLRDLARRGAVGDRRHRDAGAARQRQPRAVGDRGRAGCG